MNQGLKSLTLVLSSAILIGCGNQHKEKCAGADWRMIGVEDGDKGLPLNHISKHREACAEHGVSPDLEQYQEGRKDGVKSFCTAARGWAAGRHGKVYHGVCPEPQELAFVSAYENGVRRHALIEAVNDKRARLKTERKRFQDSESASKEAEQQLIRAQQSTPEQRSKWLGAIRKHEREEELMILAIRAAEDRLLKAERELEDDRQRLGY